MKLWEDMTLEEKADLELMAYELRPEEFERVIDEWSSGHYEEGEELSALSDLGKIAQKAVMGRTGRTQYRRPSEWLKEEAQRQASLDED